MDFHVRADFNDVYDQEDEVYGRALCSVALGDVVTVGDGQGAYCDGEVIAMPGDLVLVALHTKTARTEPLTQFAGAT